MTKWLVLFAAVLFLHGALARPETKESTFEDDKYMHSHDRGKRATNTRANPGEDNASYWYTVGQDGLSKKLGQVPNIKKAKNVIMFLGDGMSVTTLAAARVYVSQLTGVGGEETYLSFEEFPYTAFSKTYCVDSQVADSACSATAYLCGVKANDGTIGVTAKVPLSNCAASLPTNTHVPSIAQMSQAAGKRTGVVTTTRITHASPAGTYAHTADRDWECDYDKSFSPGSGPCTDIALQLITQDPGQNFNVILGCGRKKMIPNTQVDPEGAPGQRRDGQDLIATWQQMKAGLKAQYVWNKADLLAVPADTDYLMGLFDSDHCPYNLDRNTTTDPSLAEMTEAAIKILNKGNNGYFLFVEGGRIDQAHHDTKAHKALDETSEFSEAIRRALSLVDVEETLIVVTSDHAHTMTLAGYAARGGDIFGLAGIGTDLLPYSILSYANGPGYVAETNGVRHDLGQDDMTNKDYKFPALAPLTSETHGGEDVGIFAIGPWAHLFSGVIEQNIIPHIMAYASCVGGGQTMCTPA